ncbi:MAG: SHOCT domain-containing protein [Flavobacterium sp.]|nr:SHOCT domain-containing protein [Flavobacterium sp.]
MNDTIGVGLIVGLATGSSIYIWNSDNFTKSQKTGLIFCILFPPLQWISILLVLAYNKYQLENTEEAKTIKQNVRSKQSLDSTINDLIELRGKGIISEEEFMSKVYTIENQKTEFDINNSTEYKQLKNLFDSGILTKEEFENKIKRIQIIYQKEFNTEESNDIIDQTKESYSVNIDDKTTIDRKIILFFGIFIVVILIIVGSQYSNIKSDFYNEDTFTTDTSTTSYYDNYNNINHQEPINNKKFVFVVFNVETPKLHTFSIEGYNDGITNFYRPAEYFYSTEWTKSIFTSEIIEIEDYNEDSKNRILDQTELQMNEKLRISDIKYNSEIILKCNDERKKEELKDAKSKILEKNIYAFDTYSEASIVKRNETNNKTDIGDYRVTENVDEIIYFYNKPDDLYKRKGYFIGGEIVYVEKIENDFGYINYTNNEGLNSKGWVKMKYLIKN